MLNRTIQFLHPYAKLSRKAYFFTMIAAFFATTCLRIGAVGPSALAASAFDPARLAVLLMSVQFYSPAALASAIVLVGMSVYLTRLRLRAIGWPEALSALMFIPYGSLVFFMAALVPTDVNFVEPTELIDGAHMAVGLRRFIPRDAFGIAVVVSVLTAGVSILIYLCLMIGQPVDGWGLFFALPFAQGMASAILAGAWGRVPLSACMRVAHLSYVITAALLISLAFFEGFVCILLVSPLALGAISIGAWLGYLIQRRGPTNGPPTLVIACVLPVLLGAERAEGPADAPVIPIRTETVIAAPAAVVWHNVIAFSPLAPPTELPFRFGIAYPERAEIVGRGVGAVRHCIFSTGAFIEPITVWKPNRELSFTVRHTPEPMREWSPYGPLQTPHLTGYFRSLHGQFLIEPEGPNRTRLIGTTWYTDNVWPQAYWRLFSDPILHMIHRRVLKHVAELSEAEVAAQR